jgi:hypothetical protein
MTTGGLGRRELTDVEKAVEALRVARNRLDDAEQAYALARRQAGKAKLEVERSRGAVTEAESKLAVLRQTEEGRRAQNAVVPYTPRGCELHGVVKEAVERGEVIWRTHDAHVVHGASCTGCDAHTRILNPVGEIRHYRKLKDGVGLEGVELTPAGLVPKKLLASTVRT